MRAQKSTSDATVTQPDRRPYATPRLVVYGDVRQLTQGGTGSVQEQNNNSSMNFT